MEVSGLLVGSRRYCSLQVSQLHRLLIASSRAVVDCDGRAAFAPDLVMFVLLVVVSSFVVLTLALAILERIQSDGESAFELIAVQEEMKTEKGKKKETQRQMERRGEDGGDESWQRRWRGDGADDGPLEIRVLNSGCSDFLNERFGRK